MAKLSQADLLAQFKELTLVELSEFVKAFEEEFDIEMDEDGALEIQTVSGAVDFISQYVPVE